ncbi:hypothetical protein [Mesorhizobium sp. M0816]|uniref:hypothetical protein n=1 Tax=Mesorhizobium sp. M0816 TaxID=2957006 RepID=UPI00333D6437
MYTDPITLYNALQTAKNNYGRYKGVTEIHLKYFYMNESDAEHSVRDRQLQGHFKEVSECPHAASGESGDWFIAVDSTADLTGQIEVVVWGRAILATLM